MKFKNSYILLLATAFIGFMGYGQMSFQNNGPESNKRPNIILIMADDMGRECLGSYGSSSYSTPNLDRMAANGVRFENMFAQPLCTPSRVKIMTGKHNYRNYTDFGYLDPEERTFGNMLKDAGYHTMIAGKWQLNGFYNDKKPGWDDMDRPHTFGFDEYCLWQVTKEKSHGERYADPLIAQNGKELPRDEDSYGPDIFSNYILDFIERKKDGERPFFIYYPMVLVHDPFVPTPDSPEWKDRSARYVENTKYFKDMVSYTDKIVGRIMDKLEETGLAENTLVLFTGDNGTSERIVSQMADGDSVQGQKGYMTDRGTRVPMIAQWKGKSLKGAVNHDLLDFSDVLPTLQVAAKIHAPTDAVVDGNNFLSKITGMPDYPKPYVYIYYKPEWGKWKSASGVFVRDIRYKLYGDGRFYDLDNDVGEETDLPIDGLDRETLAIRQKLQHILDERPKINN